MKYFALLQPAFLVRFLDWLEALPSCNVASCAFLLKRVG